MQEPSKQVFLGKQRRRTLNPGRIAGVPRKDTCFDIGLELFYGQSLK